MSSWDAHSTLQASLGMNDLRDYRLCSGPPIEELVWPGSVVKTNYGTGPFCVVGMGGPYVESYGANYPPHWSLQLVTISSLAKIPRRLPMPNAWINELVPVDGRILQLFSNNPDEVLVIGTRPDIARLARPKPHQFELF
ncbi:hypothetical protein [Mesorhizobium sp. Z1-4]|uniref:hypothetical protein n=1 Tax=Mesorhizobium sp. Z1-4 TaxID=2448478 RepID=UPI000FD8BDB5|nr:hypothetical protein [Mesorhizobium sp. Z1-4]